jgi:putative transposase
MSNNLQWFSASELLGLPGIAPSDKGVRRQAAKQGWKWRNRSSEMGRPSKEYHISSLPPETQAHLNQQTEPEQITEKGEQGTGNGELAITNHPIPLTPYPIPTETIVNPVIPAPAPQSKQKTAYKTARTDKGEHRLNAKVDILQALASFCEDNKLQKINCQHVFAVYYAEGKIEVSEETRKTVPGVSPSTLQRWQKTLKTTENVAALAGNYGNRAGETKIDAFPQVRDFVLGMITQYPHATGRHVLMALQGRFEEEILPSLRTLERWVSKWKEENKELFTAVSNPDAWKNRYMTAFGSYSDDVVRLNQLWEMDSTPADLMLEDGRYHLIGCIDVYTRRMKLLVVPKSRAFAIGTLLRQCLLDWGVPETVKTDNGKDYTANYLQRLFTGLEIRQKLCQPFQPWQKPHVERSFRTFSHDLLELLDGYVGHDVAERQELRARQSFSDRLFTKNEEVSIKMSADEFQSFCDRWTDSIYANRPHDGLKQETPFQVLTSWQGNIKTISDERALDILLAEAPGSSGLRTVQKKGIQLEGTWFIAAELEAWIGQQVQVRFDPLDMGKIYVFDGDFKLICIAEDPARTGINRQKVAILAKQTQRERVQEGRRELKALSKKVNVKENIENYQQLQQEKADNVLHFRTKTEEYQTPDLEEAKKVIEALEPKKYSQMSAEELAEADAAMERLQLQPEMVRDSGAYFCRLWKEIKAGKPVLADDKQWMLHYMTTPEGSGALMFLEVSEEEVRELAS